MHVVYSHEYTHIYIYYILNKYVTYFIRATHLDYFVLKLRPTHRYNARTSVYKNERIQRQTHPYYFRRVAIGLRQCVRRYFWGIGGMVYRLF